MANFCTNCGNPIPEGSAFCDQCGAPVANRQDAFRIVNADDQNALNQKNEKDVYGQENAHNGPNKSGNDNIKMMPAAQSREDIKKEKHFVPIRIDPALPQDMFRDENGYIRWIIPERDKTKYYFMDENRVGFVEFYPSKEQTAGSLFKDAFKLVAGIAVISSDTYHSTDLPWELTNYEGGIGGYLDINFRLVKKIKENRKKNKIILIEDFLLKFDVETKPEQYSFVLDYMIHHIPNAIIQES